MDCAFVMRHHLRRRTRICGEVRQLVDGHVDLCDRRSVIDLRNRFEKLSGQSRRLQQLLECHPRRAVRQHLKTSENNEIFFSIKTAPNICKYCKDFYFKTVKCISYNVKTKKKLHLKISANNVKTLR